MGGNVMQLSILIALRDAASAGVNRLSDRIRAMGKDSKETARSMKMLQDLKNEIGKGVALGGIGVAGLAMLNKGVRAAGDFESSMTDLKLTFGEAGMDAAKFADQINRLDHLSVKLGNKLPGNTQMFIEMLSQLKQGGLDTETILNGAGEAVAGLAVVTNSVPKDLAKSFAQFGQQFDLKPEDYARATDLFARLKKGADIDSSELIEGSKYFQLRAGSPLGLKGLEGAETGAKLMAALKLKGLEGSVAGTGSAALFRELADTKKLKELRKETGLDLSIFDKKGKFLGVEHTIAQLEKLRKLSEHKRFSALDKLAGSEGAAAGEVLTKMGVAGWNAQNEKFAKLAGQEEQLTQKTADFNAKMEALSGTLDNLKVTAFESLLPTLGPIVDKANEGAGALQGWMKTHDGVTSTAAHLFAVGSAATAAAGGIKIATNTVRIWKIASGGDAGGGLLERLLSLKRGAKGAGDEIGGAAGKADGLGKAARGIPSTIKIGVAIAGVEYGIEKLFQLKQEIDNLEAARLDQNQSALQMFQSLKKTEQLFSEQGKQTPAALYSDMARIAFDALNQNKNLDHALDPDNASMRDTFWTWNRPYGNKWNPFTQRLWHESTAAEEIGRRAPQLEEPKVMRSFLDLLKQIKAPEEGKKNLLEALKLRFTDSFNEAMRPLNQATNESVSSLDQMHEASRTSAMSLMNDLRPAASNAASELNKIKAMMGSDKEGGPVPVVKAPGMAVGGFVRRGGLVRLHDNETVVPAQVSMGYRPDRRDGAGETDRAGRGRGGDTYNITINVPQGSRASIDPEALAREIEARILRSVIRQRELR